MRYAWVLLNLRRKAPVASSHVYLAESLRKYDTIQLLCRTPERSAAAWTDGKRGLDWRAKQWGDTLGEPLSQGDVIFPRIDIKKELEALEAMFQFRKKERRQQGSESANNIDDLQAGSQSAKVLES